jgi:hypothetical protein
VGGTAGITDAFTFTSGTWEQNAGAMTFASSNSQTLFGAQGKMVASGSGSITFGGNAVISNFAFQINTTGTVNVGGATNRLELTSTGTLQMQAGTLNIGGRLFNSGSNLSISGGTVNINTAGLSILTNAAFEMSSTSSLNMSNGTVVFQNANGSSGGDLLINAGGTKTISGGTFQFGNILTNPAQVIKVNTAVPLFNVAVGATNNVTAQLVNPLTVNNTLVVQGGTFDANGHAISVTGTTSLTGGNYLAKSGPQTLNGGMVFFGGTFTGSTGAVSTTNIALNFGTLVAPSGVFNVAGNWTKNGGTFTPGANTVTFTSAGIQTISSGASAFNNVVHTGAGTLQVISGPLVIGGTFTNVTGKFDANGFPNTITGMATLSAGDYMAKTGVQAFNGGLTISGGTFTGSTGQADIGGAGLDISSGSVTAPSGECNVAGNWVKSGGSFVPGLNTIKFTSAGTQTLDPGGSAFYNMERTLGSGTTQLVTALVVLNEVKILTGTLDANGNNITISGNWTNNASFTPGAGTTIFNGTTDQSISGTSLTQFGSSGSGGLSVDKSSGEIILNTDITVEGTLTLTNGIINGDINNKKVTL